MKEIGALSPKAAKAPAALSTRSRREISNIVPSHIERTSSGSKRRQFWVNHCRSQATRAISNRVRNTSASRHAEDRQAQCCFVPQNEGATRQPVAGGERRLEYYRGVM